jgi:hypothetical protein
MNMVLNDIARNRLFTACTILFIFAIWLGLFHKVIFKDYIVFRSDVRNEMMLPWNGNKQSFDIKDFNASASDPLRGAIAGDERTFNEIKNGHLSLWNQYIFGGQPLEGNIRSIFDITNFWYFLLPTVNAYSMVLITHLLLSGIFMMFFMKSMKVSHLGGIIAALAYMLSSFITGYIVHTMFTATIMWYPLIFLFFIKSLKQKSYICSIWGGIFYGLSVLGGCLQSAVFPIIAITLFIFWRSILSHRNKIDLDPGFEIKSGVIVIVLGLLIGSVVIIPQAYLFLFYNHGHSGWNYSLANALASVTIWLKAILPNRVVHQIPRVFHVMADPTYTYFGVFPVLLAILPFILKKASLNMKSIGLMVITVVLLTFTPLVSYLYHRALVIYFFGGAVLAGFGFDLLFSADLNRRRLKKVIISLTLIGSIAFLASVGPSILLHYFHDPILAKAEAVTISSLKAHSSDWLIPWKLSKLKKLIDYKMSFFNPMMFMPLLNLLAAFTVFYIVYRRKKQAIILKYAIVALICIDLCYYAIITVPQINPKEYPVYPENKAIHFLQKDKSLFRVHQLRDPRKYPEIFPGSTLMPWGIQTLSGYTSMHPLNIPMIAKPYDSGSAFASRYEDYNRLDLQNVKYLITGPGDRLDSPKLELVYDSEVKIYKNKDVMPRAFFVFKAEKVSDIDEAILKLNSASFDYRKTVLLEDADNATLGANQFAPIVNGDNYSNVQIIDYQSDQIKIKVKCDAPGYLVLSDTYYPGWKGYVDGIEADVLRANVAMRAVFVPAGVHLISFKYSPVVYKAAGTLTFCGLLGGLIFVLVLRLRTGRN